MGCLELLSLNIQMVLEIKTELSMCLIFQEIFDRKQNQGSLVILFTTPTCNSYLIQTYFTRIVAGKSFKMSWTKSGIPQYSVFVDFIISAFILASSLVSSPNTLVVSDLSLGLSDSAGEVTTKRFSISISAGDRLVLLMLQPQFYFRFFQEWRKLSTDLYIFNLQAYT